VVLRVTHQEVVRDLITQVLQDQVVLHLQAIKDLKVMLVLLVLKVIRVLRVIKVILALRVHRVLHQKDL